MKVVKDYFGHEIHKGDVVLYSEKGGRGSRGSFTEGVVIELSGTIRVLDDFTNEKYQREIEHHKKWNYWTADGKHSNNVINLTALGIRERMDLDEDT